MNIFYEYLMRNIKKTKSVELLDALEKYAHENNLYEDIIKIRNVRNKIKKETE